MGRAALILAVVAAGCGGREAPGAHANEVARRIVSLMPSTTSILLELGAVDRIVARTTADPQHPALEELPSVGDPLTPSRERLAALRPDLVVAWAGSRPAPLESTLAVGGRLVLLDIQSAGALRAAIDTLGALTGHRERAADLVRSLDAELARAADVVGPGPPLRVAWVVWPEPLRLAGHGSFVDEVLHLAGARNVMVPDEGPWPRVSLEALVGRDPDVVVWPRGGGVPGPEAADARWREIPAVRAGRLLRVEADSLHVPGPWLGRAVVDLARRLEAVRSALATPAADDPHFPRSEREPPGAGPHDPRDPRPFKGTAS